MPWLTGLQTPCYGDPLAFGLPNGLGAQVSDFTLEVPAVAGEPYAVSVRHDGVGPFNVEIWGTNEKCGRAEELLWWGPHVDGTQCAEFTPTRAYSHFLYVYRRLTDENYGFSLAEVTLCASGSCPAGADGEGLRPGRPISGSPLHYEITATNSLRNGYDWEIGGYGRMVLFREGSEQPVGTPTPIARGFLRMPKDDPFGDAWYCVGEGSTLTETQEDGPFDVVLKGLTRLPSCEGRARTETASIVISNFMADITSSLGDFAGTGITPTENSCLGTYCAFLLRNIPVHRWLYVTPAASVGNYLEPIATPTDIVEATLFFQVDPAEPVRIACGTTGTISYDPGATTSLELPELSDYFACPGEPIDQDEHTFNVR